MLIDNNKDIFLHNNPIYGLLKILHRLNISNQLTRDMLDSSVPAPIKWSDQWRVLEGRRIINDILQQMIKDNHVGK